MYKLRSNLLPILIILVTFVTPICYLLVMSMWLEWFDPWLLFVWGQCSEINGIIEISLLNTEVLFISPLNRILLSLTWIVLGIVLIISYYFDVKDSRRLERGLFTALIVLILQTTLPILLIDNGMFHLTYGRLIPLPITSMIVIFSIILSIYYKRKPPSV